MSCKGGDTLGFQLLQKYQWLLLQYLMCSAVCPALKT